MSIHPSLRLALTLSIGLAVASLPVGTAPDLSAPLGFSAAHADEKANKEKKAKDEKACTTDNPCNDANANKKSGEDMKKEKAKSGDDMKKDKKEKAEKEKKKS